MKVKDEAAWSLAVRDFEANGETGIQFRRYLEFWVTAAETIMEQDPDARPHRALNEAMVLTEAEVGEMDGVFLGQMLLYIIGMWEHGEELFGSLTPIEAKVVHASAAEQMFRLQEMAESATE